MTIMARQAETQSFKAKASHSSTHSTGTRRPGCSSSPISKQRTKSSAFRCTGAPKQTFHSTGPCTPSSNVVYTDGWRVFLRPRLKIEAPTPAASPPTANKANIPIEGIAHDLEFSSAFNGTPCWLEYSLYAAVEHGTPTVVGGFVGHGVVVGA